MIGSRPTCASRALVAGALAVVLAGCSTEGESGGGPTRARSAALPLEETVAISQSRYLPAEARIRVGGSITWINRDPGVLHTAETEAGAYEALPGGEDQSFDTHTLSWREPYTVTFHKPGTYSYICSLHPSMRGTVNVLELPLPTR